jgi:hypothetical protein
LSVPTNAESASLGSSLGNGGTCCSIRCESCHRCCALESPWLHHALPPFPSLGMPLTQSICVDLTMRHAWLTMLLERWVVRDSVIFDQNLLDYLHAQLVSFFSQRCIDCCNPVLFPDIGWFNESLLGNYLASNRRVAAPLAIILSTCCRSAPVFLDIVS